MLRMLLGRAAPIAALGLQDAASLVQGAPVQVQGIGSLQGSRDQIITAEEEMEILTNSVDKAIDARDQWPDMRHLWDDIKETMGNVTESVGEITEDIEDKFGELVNNTMDDIATRVAGELNRALEAIKISSDRLLSKTLAKKAELLASMNTSDSLLYHYEMALSKTLNAAIEGWEALENVAKSAISVLVSALMVSGQEDLSRNLATTFNQSIIQVDNFLQDISAVSQDVEGINTRASYKVDELLRKMDAKFKAVLDRIPAFGASFQQAFQDLTDRIIDALPRTTASVHQEFSSTQHHVTSILWRTRSAGRELALGCHQATVLVAREEKVSLPSWEDDSTKESAAARPGFICLVAAMALAVSRWL